MTPIIVRRITVIAMAALALAGSARAAEQEFSTWLHGVRAEARDRGMKEGTITSALSDVKPLPRVVELDRRQPEFTLTLEQ